MINNHWLKRVFNVLFFSNSSLLATQGLAFENHLVKAFNHDVAITDVIFSLNFFECQAERCLALNSAIPRNTEENFPGLPVSGETQKPSPFLGS